MDLKPVNKIDSDSNTIRVSDGNSPIRLIFKDVKGEVINLYDKIDYFYLTKDDEKFYSVTDISYDGDEVIIRLPKLRKGRYKAEIRDKDGSIYPANEDLYILLRRSFEDDKDIYYFGHREDILNNVEPIIIQHIDKNPDKFKGERGQQGFPGRDGLKGVKGDKGEQGIQGIQGIKGDKGDKGDKGNKGDTGEKGEDVDYSLIFQNDSIQVKIPSDFLTLQDAIEHYQLKKNGLNVVIELLIESGHVIEHGLYLQDGDYSKFKIKSEDAIVLSNVSGHLIEGIRANLPTLSCLIDMQNIGLIGIRAIKNSRGSVEINCGVINAGSNGIIVSEGSHYHLFSSNFSGANDRCLWVSNGSIAEAELSNFSNSGGRAVYCSRGSKANIHGSNVKNSGETAVYAIRSEINAQETDVSGALNYGYYSGSGSTIICNDGIANNTGNSAVYCSNASRISASRIIIENSKSLGIECTSASIVDAGISSIKNCIGGVLCDFGSTVNVRSSNILDNTGIGILSKNGSNVTCTLTNIKNSTEKDLNVSLAGFIYGYSAKTTNSVGSSIDLSDTNITELSQLHARGIIWG